VRIRGYADGTPCWAELHSTDPVKAAVFYAELFGWQLDGAVFQRDGLGVAGLRTEPADTPIWMTYFAIDDLAALSDRVTGSGGTVVAAPAAVGDRGQAALFRDVGGALFGAWQRGTFAGAQVGTEPDAVSWSDLDTRDEDGAIAFYGKVFGWSAQPGAVAADRGYRDWVVNERVVGGMMPLAPWAVEVAPQWRTTVEVRDIAATVQRCLDLGGRVALGSVKVPVGRYTRLTDPLGAPFGVMEMIPELRGLPG
jgi:predicted enzyme related to lactoylglutathione lyase